MTEVHSSRSIVDRARMALLAAALAVTGGLLHSPTPAAAAVDRPMLLPFTAGETWYVCRGYQYASHAGTYALDLTVGGVCNANGATGRAARSPWTGTLAIKGGDYVCVNLDTGASSFKTGHIFPASATVGSRVSLGQQLGTVRGPEASNAFIAHQHIEVYGAAGCDNSGARVPFSGSARMQCAPNLPIGGSGSNGQWSGTVLSRPTDATAKAGTPFWDICNSEFKTYIAWAYNNNITSGCEAGATARFCPTTPVTREQMATFLVRLYNYPAATRDYFSDDANSSHQADINKIAQAGITSGCVAFTATSKGLYCPSDTVPRGQMAAFLVRSENLPPTSQDFFTDDNGHSFENQINAAAAAGIFGGCGSGLACPNDVVTREQMTAFLWRAAQH